MDSRILADSKCWFGGGTAIVLSLGEYRRSLDLDFLCADRDGYRQLRNAFSSKGIAAIFPPAIKSLREFQSDAYGIRTLVEYKAQKIRLEIIRESRIELEGAYSSLLGIPILSTPDMFAEKLLANADRCQDRAVSYRDAIDLGRLVEFHGHIPAVALQKAERAYGDDIARKAAWIVNRLLSTEEIRYAADSLQMDFAVAHSAITSLRKEFVTIWPDAGIEEESKFL